MEEIWIGMSRHGWMDGWIYGWMDIKLSLIFLDIRAKEFYLLCVSYEDDDEDGGNSPQVGKALESDERKQQEKRRNVVPCRPTIYD